MASTPLLLVGLGVAALTTVFVVYSKPNVDAAFFAVEASGPLNVPIRIDFYIQVIALMALTLAGTIVSAMLLWKGLKKSTALTVVN